LGVKRPGREADHSPPSLAEIKEYAELYLHSPSTPSWRGAQLKHRDNFTLLYLYLKGRDHSKDTGVDGKIILEWILGKQGG
jgi:hypothetical protein